MLITHIAPARRFHRRHVLLVLTRCHTGRRAVRCRTAASVSRVRLLVTDELIADRSRGGSHVDGHTVTAIVLICDHRLGRSIVRRRGLPHVRSPYHRVRSETCRRRIHSLHRLLILLLKARPRPGGVAARVLRRRHAVETRLHYRGILTGVRYLLLPLLRHVHGRVRIRR